jgi:hypothetical protein
VPEHRKSSHHRSFCRRGQPEHQNISGKANTSLNNLTTAGNTVIDNRINSIVNAKFQVVSALPSNPDSNTFYFITE